MSWLVLSKTVTGTDAMTLNVRLLGRVQLDLDGRPISMRGHKPLALLAYLLVTGQPATRRHLIDLLFDGPDDPHANLRWTLAELRRAIGGDFIAAARQEIAFNFTCEHTLDVAALLSGDTGA
jgi:DNA-binding SARP family transcriptional activator